jgi:hypothetical protein
VNETHPTDQCLFNQLLHSCSVGAKSVAVIPRSRFVGVVLTRVVTKNIQDRYRCYYSATARKWSSLFVFFISRCVSNGRRCWRWMSLSLSLSLALRPLQGFCLPYDAGPFRSVYCYKHPSVYTRCSQVSFYIIWPPQSRSALLLLPPGFPSYSILTICPWSVLIRCPSQAIILLLISATISRLLWNSISCYYDEWMPFFLLLSFSCRL